MAPRRSASKASTPAGDAHERRLIEAAQADPGRFAALYEANFERVYAYLARRARDREQAQDLTSEVFYQALRKIGDFEWRGVPLSAWLIRIAANLLADAGNRAARERALRATEDPPEATCMEEIEHRARLFRMVDGLPDDQRRVIVMRFAEQRSIREIAGQLGRSEGAVKQLQFRALQGLRARMGKSDG
jgi:RNA polymerase sigma-70 factor, ECF subfamily